MYVLDKEEEARKMEDLLTAWQLGPVSIQAFYQHTPKAVLWMQLIYVEDNKLATCRFQNHCNIYNGFRLPLTALA